MSNSYENILEASLQRTHSKIGCGTLKELKTSTSNKEGSKKAIVQVDDVHTQLRGANSHATRNILKL